MSDYSKFEDSLEELKKCADSMKQSDLQLNKALESYEDGIKHYNICKEILDDASRQIQVIKERQL